MPPITLFRHSIFCRPLAVLVAASLGACASVPDVPPVGVEVPTAWHHAQAPLAEPAASDAPAADRWWQDFGSAELDALIERALAANRDLRVAAARVAQARALAGEVAADRWPQLDAVAGTSNGRQTTLDPKASLASVGVQASWETDVFGQKGLARRAARLDAQSAELARTATQTAIAAQVASIYVDAAGLARRVALAHRRLDVATRSEAAQAGLLRAGLATRAEVDRRHAETRALRAEQAELGAGLELRQVQLAVLLGATPGSLSLDFNEFGSLRLAAPRWLPGELLERRPDVQRALRDVDAAAARVGVARLDLYPKFVFSWANASENAQIVDQDAATNIALGYGLSVALPIFDGGRIRSRIAVNEARLQEAMAVYEKTMLDALADAESALVRADSAVRALDELDAAARSSASAADKTQRLFDAGLVERLAVLDARQAALRASDAGQQARVAYWQSAVDVRRAFCASIGRQTPQKVAVTK